MKRFTLKQLDEIHISRKHVENSYKLPSKKWEVVRKCSGKICCEFSMQYHRINEDATGNESRLSYIYKLTASSSSSSSLLKDSDGLGSRDMFCAVIACTSEDSKESCGKRRIRSEVVVVPSFKFTDIRVKMIMEVETSEHDYLLMPTNVDFSMLPLDTRHFEFSRSSVYSVNRWEV